MRVNQVSALHTNTIINFPHYFLPNTQTTDSQISDIRSVEGGSVEPEAKKKRRALVVDDVADVTEMLEVLLTHAGYEVTTASSAPAALAAASAQNFDIVISDIGMPEMSGYELARALRDMPGYASIPMVAVTGYSMFNDRGKSLASGFTAHMTKPIEPRVLLDLIEQL